MNQVQRTPAARTQIGRPLKVLIPLIKTELEEGEAAGLEHYRRAGQMLLEARDQVAYGAWGKWISKNFELSTRTAQEYMRWARVHNESRGGAAQVSYTSMREMTGHTERAREQTKTEAKFRKTLRDIAPDDYSETHHAREEEIRLHRELATELVDLGYKALAMRLHPDRGGSKAAMARLNTVRDALKHIAQTRRFES